MAWTPLVWPWAVASSRDSSDQMAAALRITIACERPTSHAPVTAQSIREPSRGECGATWGSQARCPSTSIENEAVSAVSLLSRATKASGGRRISAAPRFATDRPTAPSTAGMVVVTTLTRAALNWSNPRVAMTQASVLARRKATRQRTGRVVPFLVKCRAYQPPGLSAFTPVCSVRHDPQHFEDRKDAEDDERGDGEVADVAGRDVGGDPAADAGAEGDGQSALGDHGEDRADPDDGRDLRPGQVMQGVGNQVPGEG